MTIAVHISFSDSRDDPSKNFNYNCFTILAGKYPEHHFIFIFDRPYSPILITQKNITPVLLTPQIKNRLLGYYWHNLKLPGLLEKYHADIFINHEVNCSIRTTIKQCMILQDLSFLQKENLFSRTDSRYLKKYFKKFVTKASCIAVTSPYVSTILEGFSPQTKGKAFVIGYGLSGPEKKISHDEVQRIKDKYTEGKEYFLFYITSTTAANTTTLLKAFSAFKKRQLSNMQLVLVFSSTKTETDVKGLATYKYRSEVKMITPGNDQLLNKITSAAYAAIYLPAMEVMEDIGLLALKNNIPLISTDNGFCKSLYDDATLFTTNEEKNIAEKMMLLYKDENLRNDLVNKGSSRAAAYSWENTATGLWQALLHTAEQ